MPSLNDMNIDTAPENEPEKFPPTPLTPKGRPTPTPEQIKIIDAASSTTDNMIISALAGAAKTSTLVMIAEALPKTSILCLAFNKKIATEMQERLPTSCTAKTLNALGHQAWASFLNKRYLEVDAKKTYRIVKMLIESVDDKEEQEFLYDRMSDLMKAVDAGKTAGYIPTGHFPLAKRIMDDDDYFEWLDEEPSQSEKDVLIAASLISLREAHAGKIDFNDQILCSTVFPATFPQYPLVMVDEAQDLSALNHVMLGKIAKKRLIAVGDECQAIYGFRGAHQDSMPTLAEKFDCVPYTLTISFRCPIKVVEEARWRAPAMQYPTWAKEGEVKHLTSWGPDDLPERSEVAMICRNNAPLFSMAFALLRGGRYPELVGNDIGKSLIKTLKGLGLPTMSTNAARQKVAEWKEAKLKKARSPGKIEDQAECLLIFLEQGKNLGDAMSYAEHILATSGPIKLMTGHKSKGLEFDEVFFLDQHLIGKEQQELNLRYVIQTRAKKYLTYVDSKNFELPKKEENEE